MFIVACAQRSYAAGQIPSSEICILDLTQFSTPELSSLTKAMDEARLSEVWDDPIVWLAPFVIDLHVAAVAGVVGA